MCGFHVDLSSIFLDLMRFDGDVMENSKSACWELPYWMMMDDDYQW